ncbi:MAG: exodeoxyribonuclease VII small subunit [Desulfovibrionaceae bacterium]|jgi:exodeoxyribonuclease VII small subunit|nr:exodeoxyribonuclease VII small subunit [Desulfovibrionaceae bacterium]
MAAQEGGMDFEKKLKRLAAVVEKLESGELPLEKGVALYKEGLTLARECRETLADVRNEIAVFTEEGLKEFAPEAEETDAERADGEEEADDER